MAVITDPKTVSDVVAKHLNQLYTSKEFPVSERIVETLVGYITASEVGTEAATENAENVREYIWNTWSGGGMSALATRLIYADLGRLEDTDAGWQ